FETDLDYYYLLDFFYCCREWSVDWESNWGWTMVACMGYFEGSWTKECRVGGVYDSSIYCFIANIYAASSFGFISFYICEYVSCYYINRRRYGNCFFFCCWDWL